MMNQLNSRNSNHNIDKKVHSQLTCRDIIMKKHFTQRIPSTKYFNKLTYTFRTFISDFTRMTRNRHRIKDASRSQRVSRIFAEHIMLVITSVNGCIYCEWGHTKFALKEGSTSEEISAVLAFNFGKLPPEEHVGLLFAQHYAKTLGHPSKVSLHRLVKEYGLEMSQDIISYCEMITMGNLLGNSVSAFISRLHGIPPKDGSFFFELLIYVLGGFWMDRYMTRKEAALYLKP